MTTVNAIFHLLRTLCTVGVLTLTALAASAQMPDDFAVDDSLAAAIMSHADSLEMQLDMSEGMFADDIIDIDAPNDTISMSGRDWNSWRPNPQRAMWLAIVLPGAGQIYNRKFWKLPIFYGGFVGCFYAMRWNNMMYNDYSQAYMDLMDDNPETHSYDKFQHLGAEVTNENRTTWENKFRRRKDYSRRYRDMSAFIMIGVYALSVIDAYVDASLSEFDISDDLSLRVAPAIINEGGGAPAFRFTKQSALGIQCIVNF